MQTDPINDLADAGLATIIVQFLKNTPWFPWLEDDTDTANKFASSIAAVVVAGKQAFLDPTTHILFHGTFTQANVQGFVFTTFKQMMLQWALYHAAVKEQKPPAIKSDPLLTDEEKRVKAPPQRWTRARY